MPPTTIFMQDTLHRQQARQDAASPAVLVPYWRAHERGGVGELLGQAGHDQVRHGGLVPPHDLRERVRRARGDDAAARVHRVVHLCGVDGLLRDGGGGHRGGRGVAAERGPREGLSEGVEAGGGGVGVRGRGVARGEHVVLGEGGISSQSCPSDIHWVTVTVTGT